MRVPEFVRGFSNLTTYEGEQVRFEVEVRGEPTPTLTWYRDGEVIRDSPDFQVKRNETKKISFIFFIRISSRFSFFRSSPKEIVVYFIYPKFSWKIKVSSPVRHRILPAHQTVQLDLLLNHDHNNKSKKFFFFCVAYFSFSLIFPFLTSFLDFGSCFSIHFLMSMHILFSFLFLFLPPSPQQCAFFSLD